ncbi:hypothetical protein BGZ80_006569 [Entomortierella chlamydospora]|uniref:Uncharacterized protein n=1 Tax=Entomortierella chlamydospora TaxID=101097 RepID=A0A9P6MGX6_9FUNG|nr:hypothetical protein BGZ80_006569 [Entomortierella chlamydospora]
MFYPNQLIDFVAAQPKAPKPGEREKSKKRRFSSITSKAEALANDVCSDEDEYQDALKGVDALTAKRKTTDRETRDVERVDTDGVAESITDPNIKPSKGAPRRKRFKGCDELPKTKKSSKRVTFGQPKRLAKSASK